MTGLGLFRPNVLAAFEQTPRLLYPLLCGSSAASVIHLRRLAVRAWYAFAHLRQKLLKLYPQEEAQKLAAEAVFSTRAQDALDALVIGHSQAG